MWPIFFEFQIDNYINVLAGFGACASAIAALFTIRQVKKQREASYQPDIYFGFIGLKKLTIKNLSGVESKELCFQLAKDNRTIETHSILHSIENIGLGTAKDIKIIWDFNFKKAFSAISKAQEYGNSKIRVEMERGNTLVIRAQSNTMFYVWSDKEALTTQFDFVLPRRDEKFAKSPSIPIEIIQYFAAYCLIRHNLLLSDEKYADLFHEEFEAFPPLTAHVSYNDIGNKTHTKTFLTKLSFSTPFEESMTPLKGASEINMRVYVECISI